jgi:hypothetical protein
MKNIFVISTDFALASGKQESVSGSINLPAVTTAVTTMYSHCVLVVGQQACDTIVTDG